MASNNGYFVTASDTKAAIQDSNRTQAGYNTWRQMYGAVDLNKQQQMSALKYDYDKAIGDAYAQAFASKQQVANSNYIDSYKDELTRRIDDTLEQAYGSYLQNYAKGAESLESEAAGYRSNITNALEEQAKNTSNLINKVYDYLQYTYDNYYNDPTAKAQLERNGMDFSKFEYDRFLKDELDAEGNATGRKILKTMDELAAGDVNAPGIFTTDEGGNLRLNDAGIDYFDYLMNSDNSVYGLSTFGSWLRNEDSELYDWYTSENPYNYAQDKLGRNTNAASLKQLIGMKSDDESYSPEERKYGMSQEFRVDKKIREVGNMTDPSEVTESYDAAKKDYENGLYTDDEWKRLQNSYNLAERKAYKSTRWSGIISAGSTFTIKFQNGTKGILTYDDTTVTVGKAEKMPSEARFTNGQAFIYNGTVYVAGDDGKAYHVRNYGDKSAYSRLKKLLTGTVYDVNTKDS